MTRTEYDANGASSPSTDAEGGVTRTEYDAAGNRTATIDALGRRTEYRYDERGQLIETIYPDATPADLADNPADEDRVRRRRPRNRPHRRAGPADRVPVRRARPAGGDDLPGRHLHADGV